MKDDEISDILLGYADGMEKIMDKTGMSVEEIEEWGLNHNIERCPCCDVWTESYNLISDEDEIDGQCDNCRERHD